MSDVWVLGYFEIGCLICVGWYLHHSMKELFETVDGYFCKPASECSKTYRCPKCGEEAR